MAQMRRLVGRSLLRASKRSLQAPRLNGVRRAMSTQMITQGYEDEMRRKWTIDPMSVHPSWAAHFEGPTAIIGGVPAPAGSGAGGAAGAASPQAIKVVHLIRAYQVRGHEVADLDPLRLQPKRDVPELDYKTYGFTEADLDRPMDLSSLGSDSGIVGFLDTLSSGPQTLRDVLNQLQKVYSSTVGVEYMHIPNREKCNWLRARMELPRAEYTREERLQILERLTFAVRFEEYLDKKFNAKRFGLEGVESMIPGMKTLIDTATQHGVTDVTMGMPHRGRLNVLSNVIRKPMEEIFKEFQGTNYLQDEHLDQDLWSPSGDVKYHLGTSLNRKYPDGRQVGLTLMANPSHLEAVNPLVLGSSHGQAYYKNDSGGHTTMPVLIHGDAAFAGQGVVYESMQFTHLENYKTGGAVHIICNNQIGFTTDPSSSRSTRYASDLGKTFDCPIFHVNGDDPEAVTRVFELAAQYRQAFHDDVIVDLIGYRRFGHNEMDQPHFTQPRMYDTVKQHKSVLKLYQARLVAEGHLSQADVDTVQARVDAVHQKAYEDAPTYEYVEHTEHNDKWSGLNSPRQQSAIRDTGVSEETLQHVAKAVGSVPEGFTLHRQIKKIYDAKAKSLEEGKNIDWGTAEALAFGTILSEGTHVRLSGQDVERGTFSHRHAVLHDQKEYKKYMPLNSLTPVTQGGPAPAKVTVSNSHLSEMGVLGFELGYSMVDPNSLVIWEAQFGDFANGAQVIIDQFISAGEKKWGRQSGLVMLLPHGYDGQGPEHSSCRIERFLQQCDEDADTVPSMNRDVTMQIQHHNWQIVNCTTPANYYHVLRRQVQRNFRKPLVVAAPKNLLKLRAAQSTFDEMTTGTAFQRVIPEVEEEALVAPDKVRRVVLCSGKIYYELAAARANQKVDDVAIVRVEQLAPFPFDLVAAEMSKYANAEVVWAQEEPKNMGAWQFVQDRIMTSTRVLNGEERRPAYVGRRTSASPAVGYGGVHAKEQSDILETALSDRVHDYGHGRSQKSSPSV